MDEPCRVRVVVLPAFGGALGEAKHSARDDGHRVGAAHLEQEITDLAAVALRDNRRIAEIRDRAPVAEELEPLALEFGRRVGVAGVGYLHDEALDCEHVT